MMICAHRRIKDGQAIYEPLEEHEKLTCEYAQKISSKEVVNRLGYDYSEFLEGIRFHDRGKVNINFQEKLSRGLHKYKNCDHSILSAILYLQSKVVNNKVLYKQWFLNAYVIHKHHSSLTDLKDFDLKLNNIDEFQELIRAEIRLKEPLIDRLRKLASEDFTIKDFFYIRYFFSVLGSADIFATQEFMSDYKFEKCKSFSEIKGRLNSDSIIQNIKSEVFGEGINRFRSEMALEAQKNYMGGVSLLEAPTGAGKTKTGYLLAEKANKNKLFYVAPFNNISAQTYNDLLKIFSVDEVGLINSTSEIEYKDKENNNEKDNEEDVTAIGAYNSYYHLNSPIVVTSAVKLFDILYSNKKRDILNFYNLENSCVIIDEIQAFNINTWKNFSQDITILSEIFNMDIIIMSATLPNLDIFSNSFTKLIKNRDYYFKNPYFKDRVEIISTEISDLNYLKEMVLNETKEHDKILIEFINKKMAYEFYNLLKLSMENVLIITGDTKNLERQEVIKTTEDRLKKWRGVLIGTQVIEAGVDIDFDIGFKDISILESEEQFAGRINRNCSKSSSKLYLFNCYDARKILKKDVRVTPELTLLQPEVLEMFKNKDFYHYYEKVLNFIDRKDIFSNLTNFKEKYKSMELIDNDSESIFILSHATEDIFSKYNEIYENKDLDFYAKSIELKNIRGKILENSITVYKNDNRLENVKEKNFLKYFYIVDLE